MVNMEIEVISSETIKPCSKTPPHLKTCKLSLLDQLTPPFYTPLILYYPVSEPNSKANQVVTLLKNSLSKTLSRFYPLAGRIKDHLCIDCNDEGVVFIEARVRGQLAEILRQPKGDILQQLLPCQPFLFLPTDNVDQVAVQINIFSCGGIAISVCFLHKFIDGATMSAFIKSWAAMARGSYDKSVFPDFTAGSQIFHPRSDKSWNVDDLSVLKTSWLIKQGKGIRRRFVFDAAAISALKEKGRSKLVSNPSSVAVVSCFIWKCATAAASKAACGPQHGNSSIMFFAANIRPIVKPPIPEYCAGNMVWQAVADHKTSPQEECDLQDFVSTLKEAASKINNNYLQELKGDGVEMISKFRQQVEERFSVEKPADMYMFSSWCKFGFNQVDFGWGMPIWVSIVGGEVSPWFTNVLILIETCRGNGIEAWLLLDEHEMAILESDPEFLSFASLNPPIDFCKA